MRTINSQIAVGEHYHLYNRGVAKQVIFHDGRDYARFLFLLLFFQSPVGFTNLSRPTTSFVKRQTFNINPDIIEKIVKQRGVVLKALCLMPNHFHLIIQELKPVGISRYMQRALTAYAKYYHAKYRCNGHVFQGVYRVNHIKDNDQLLYTSAYIHKNPVDLGSYRKNYLDYPWASGLDYSRGNRWGELLVTADILDQFDSGEQYARWVKNTVAKEIVEALDDWEMCDV